jgi:hypothetical protein
MSLTLQGVMLNICSEKKIKIRPPIMKPKDEKETSEKVI